MKVSVIIPVYNGKNYIKQSINSALNQTFKDVEVIVIDDFSNDGTYE
jgi:Glycosyltransferases involved in cell wall biogenesis